MCDKNMLLVNTIEKFPCLYNYNLHEYLKKDVTDKAWNEVANQTQLSVGECKEKWKNLRYGLLRSLKPNPDGSGKKRYYLHRDMEFVLPYIKFSKQPGVTTLPSEEEVDDETNANERELEQSPHQQHYLELDFLNCEPTKKKMRTSYDQFNNFLQQSNNNNENEENPRRLFLLSLLPEVNELTETQMRTFRRKIFALLDDIVEGSKPFSQNDVIKSEPL